MSFSQISLGDTSLTAQHQSDGRPLVSVIIPCYNSARYLAETIESVLAQTYPRVEIILIDDGSTDATAQIAQDYPVNYVYQANRGISAARNSGFLHSQGKYVLFLDHDDRLLPRGVEAGVKLLEEHPECAIAVANINLSELTEQKSVTHTSMRQGGIIILGFWSTTSSRHRARRCIGVRI